ncbi:RNA-directed DNA polymerase, eukaryota, Reverse transcriptase zinc-binding domain protein [Artemisia annua]|uniref:RNA-directed DNA polymerase, eukaryota, Reverse transcriptase zinc-binding domain protein n=1 Tax=Artemisia annua TaxID=35608 RepID=A0A2U1N8C9_ARTAN|nr:RNA-directed DNA polymerase, eukaryota, Reverse transcriptase zinc-binding domain protein [Artemisia annua]
MNKVCNWKPILDKFHNRLTNWKAKTLSYGGRLTLIKSVLCALAPKSVLSYLEKLRRNFFWGGSLESNKLAWVAWKKVCSPSTSGGLGIGRLQASNLAMLTKWWWRFYTEPDSLWHHVITSIYGAKGGLGTDLISPSHITGPWKSIIDLKKSPPQIQLKFTFCVSEKSKRWKFFLLLGRCLAGVFNFEGDFS